MTFRILALPGDGIGPEVVAVARRVLEALAAPEDLALAWQEALIGGAAIEAEGVPLPDATLEAALEADAVLLGAVGGPRWEGLPGVRRPEAGLLQLRRALEVFANLRPIRTRPALAGHTPLKPEVVAGTDMLFVRELTGGLYFGDKGRDRRGAYDLCRYETEEIERVVRLAARLARERRGRLTLIDKANVLETSRLWREVTRDLIAREFTDLDFEVLLVDAAAMLLIREPSRFDVIVTENLFGDILTDEAGVLAGSLGLVPSASLGGDTGPGLYEPIHGSAPDIAGRGIANPIGMLESLALMLDRSMRRPDLAARLSTAIDRVLEAGILPADLGGTATTADIEEAVLAHLSLPAEPAAAG
ncbi:MAG: 3-isopropylmalate dehydrogenase [Alphaproteobacteria bacterium]|nr:MAG: 3-isopropylmalate dehydrogenase [Alphaproteobacteria bacterium]